MAGYSGTPLAKKLGLKTGMKAYLHNPPPSYKKDLADALKEISQERTLGNELDFIHFFSTSRAELEKAFSKLKDHLKPNGSIWISWPKGSSKIETDISGDVVREVGLKTGLVDIKVCAVDEDWSGLKFVFRKSDRK